MNKTNFNAKQIITFSTFLFWIFFMTSCKTNLDDVYNRLDNHEQRLKTLETIIKTANVEIEKLDGLIKAQAGKITIVSYQKLSDDTGYTLSMSDGSKIILKNGQDGLTPTINIKTYSDGLLYWTLNNEFMRDADGKMILAQGVKGADGITPTLRVNMDNLWEVSIDGGKYWQAILDAEGNSVKAIGPKGEQGSSATVDLQIEENKDTVIIIYNGTTYTLSKANSKATRPTLPIEYVAEYNINIAGDGFTENYFNDASGLFNWYEANGVTHETYNPTGKNILNAPAFKDKYHLPSHAECRYILPDIIIDWTEDYNQYDVEEEIPINGEMKKYTADYDLETMFGACYAIRFKGNGDNLRAAYRYLYTDNPTDTKSAMKKMMTVNVRYLGPENTSLTLADITMDEFWNEPGVEYITRIFPATGYSEHNTDEIYRQGEQGYHWTTADHSPDWPNSAISFNFYEFHFDVSKDAFQKKSDEYAIRPFKNY